ncbi:MAG: RNA methyltransferase [Ruminococcaceae bacterium]|nr:RNA methyltransferase [Oscillospiraceae bacterium]
MKKEESRFSDSTLFEGMTSIRSVIHANENGTSDRRIKRIIVDRDKLKSRAKELGWLKYKSGEMGFTIEHVSSDEIDSITTGNSHGGIIAECSERTIPSLEEAEIKPNGFYVMIEGIEDPYNFGYAMRSLYACGADGIVLSPRNWMSAAGVVCRSSAGASELLPIYECDPIMAAEIFKRNGYRVLCAGIRDSVSSFDCDMRYPVFLIVGGEKRGISGALLDTADEIVRIDYAADFGGSLSAASAASMLGYEVMRQNRK